MIKGKYYDLDYITNIKYITGWWFQTFVMFHNIWDVILPIDFHIFSIWLKRPTRLLLTFISHIITTNINH